MCHECMTTIARDYFCIAMIMHLSNVKPQGEGGGGGGMGGSWGS